MSTKMTDEDWDLALEVFRSCLPARGAKARGDRLFLEALHYFTVHNISWRALPERFGHWLEVARAVVARRRIGAGYEPAPSGPAPRRAGIGSWMTWCNLDARKNPQISAISAERTDWAA